MDGDFFTRWESAELSTSWLSVDLEKEKLFNKVVFYDYGGNISSFELQYSDDGAVWLNSNITGNILKTQFNNGIKTTIYLQDNIAARYVRLYITEAESFPSICHFGIYSVLLEKDKWVPIEPADLSGFSHEDFTDREIQREIPFLLAHFHTLANNIRTNDPYKGFIDIPIYRALVDNQPYNMRIMENNIALSYFLSVDRAWNPYYNSRYVRYRLELVFDYMISMQDSIGRWSEYGWGRYNLPSTAFGAKFLAESLKFLEDAAANDQNFILPNNYEAARGALRKAIMAALTIESLYSQGIKYTNQYGNVWAAGLNYLSRYEDSQLEALLHSRMDQSVADFQSPAGYFYEDNSIDYNYNIGTHHNNVTTAWHYIRGNSYYEQFFLNTEEEFYRWLSYTTVIEPGDSFIVLNSGLSGRLNATHRERITNAIGEKLLIARAFAQTKEEHENHIQQLRQQLTASWPDVGELRVGVGTHYNAYAFELLNRYEYYPAEAEKEDAKLLIPYLAEEYFNHQLVDNRVRLEVTAVRRPSYYAVFNAGDRHRNQQQFGLGILWHPEGGIMLNTQHKREVNSSTDILIKNRDLSWGTKPHIPQKSEDEVLVYESDSIETNYYLNGLPFETEAGSNDLPYNNVEIRYSIGNGAGEKSVLFTEDKIEVSVLHNGGFTECLPLMIRSSDTIETGVGYFTLNRGGTKLKVTFNGGASPRLVSKNYGYNGYTLRMLCLDGFESMSYAISFE